MGYFGIPFRNGVPIGLGSIVGFGAQQFDPSELFVGGTAGAWYDPSDLTTMFTTSAGTTPVAMPGQGSAVSVGAMLDKRATAYSVLFNGSARVTATGVVGSGTGDFTYEAWVYPLSLPGTYQVVFDHRTGGAHTDGMFMYVSSGGNLVIYNVTASTNAVTLNQWNHIAFVRSSGVLTYYINGVSGGSQSFTRNNTDTTFCVGNPNDGLTSGFNGYISNARFTAAAVYTGAFTPAGPLTAITDTRVLTCGVTWASNPSFTVTVARVDGLNPFTASPVGNHAIAFNNTTARPELRARVNLLTYSEEFDNADWAKLNATVSANAGVAPDGTNTADLVYPSSSGSYHGSVYQTGRTGNRLSVCAKAAGFQWLYFVNTGGSAGVVWFDVLNGITGTVGAGYTATITSLGNGWYRCTAEAASGNFVSPQFGPSNTDNSVLATASGTNGLLFWGADLRPANIGANVPAYQRIADANTYDTSGFPLYLRFDGIDDSMYTPANLNLSGTDKVAVFAGVRRNATVTQFPVEFSAQSDANNGTFGIGNDSGGAEYFFNSRGTTLRQIVVDNAAYNAPVSNVATLSADIAAPSMIARLNGTQVGSNTSSQGTGNYGTYPLYIGSRNNSAFWLNGHLHSLIIAGSAVSAGNISATEQWVAGKVGLVIP